MDKTIVLNSEDLSQHAEVPGKPGWVLSLSAYDIPRSVTARMDASAKTLFISFHYLDNEDDDRRRLDDNLTIICGKHSGKVLGFELANVAQPPRDVTVLFKGVDQQLSRATRDNQRLNYTLIRDVLSRNIRPLIASAYEAFAG